MILTVFAAYALSKDKLKGRRWISGMILFTMYFNGGIIPTFLVIKNLGMYDQLTSLYIPSAVNVFNFIVMRTFFREIPKSLEEAAYLDGATDVQILFKIVLPLSMPIIATIDFSMPFITGMIILMLLFIFSPLKSIPSSFG